MTLTTSKILSFDPRASVPSDDLRKIVDKTVLDAGNASQSVGNVFVTVCQLVSVAER